MEVNKMVKESAQLTGDLAMDENKAVEESA
jgi:hypothetical protein